MIPTKVDIDIQGTLPGEDVQMQLDNNSLAHLMSVLINLYSNKTLAIVREYSTNALDSHIEAGVTRPIEVSTPTDFKPFFTVRDYGVGMDAETIRNVYSRYGASTKRGSNAQNGMLGLGSKSALTYTTQFKITGVKDGVKTFVIVSRSADGSGVMKIISQTATSEHNGVTIEIPVSNRREIEKVAYDFFRFWQPGTVLLNGKDPAVTDELRLGKFVITDQISGDHVVMGNVAYPTGQDNRLFKNYNSRTSVIAYVDMGEVNFTPSRESLHLTELTKATLDALRKELAQEVKKHIEEKIDKVPTHGEAIRNYFEIQKTNLSVYAGNITYRGEDIPWTFDFDWAYYIHTGSSYTGNHTEAKKVFNNRSVIVHGYEHARIHTTHRQKIKLWLEANNLTDTGYIYFTKTIANAKWLSDIRQVRWEDVNSSIKLQRPKSAGVTTELFDSISDRGYRISNQKIDTTKKIVYSSPVTFSSDESRDLIARFLTNRTDTQLVLVNKNKWKSFVKEIPTAVHIDDKVKQIVDDYVTNLTGAEKIFLKSNWKDRSFCDRLDAKKVDDPAIKAAIVALKGTGLTGAVTKQYELMQLVARAWDLTYPDFRSTEVRLFERYSLLDVYGHRSASSYPLDHVYLYLNSCYKSNLIKYQP